MYISIYIYMIAPRGISPGQYYNNIKWTRYRYLGVRCRGFDATMISVFGLSSTESAWSPRPRACSVSRLGVDVPILRTVDRSSIVLFNCFDGVRQLPIVFDSDRLLSLGTQRSSLTVLILMSAVLPWNR